MKRKWFLPALLLLSIPLGEAYQLFRNDHIEKAWFLLIDLYQTISWYIKDTGEGLDWILFLLVWYLRERKRNKFWSGYILMFLIFRIVDLCIYWLNHRHAGIIYGFCYLSIIIYAGYNTIKEYKKYKSKKS